ncbi:NUDIX domain-containing protein [Tumebacillus sp. ITR2]|uniref:NUDIX domain-containing protein n=1 Tax=Tumebacillus amylolyticus TaxID=2801339 RepID=A0ABS1JDM1_9BACL|nr:NUDIX domain-containing protein [Tumebacillus amylolyticus]MBL0388320.1 NUDIX domain-containing protein [Tumebacillus amylolyticus]
MMISFEVQPNDKFHLRAASVVIHNGRVLFQKPVELDLWFLPGGRVEYYETAEVALRREMMEEFGVEVVSSQLLWMVENFFEETVSGSRVHEVGMYHLVEIPEDHPIRMHEGEFAGLEEGYVHRWIAFDELDQYNIVPAFVTPALRELSESKQFKHIVNREVR